MDAILPGIEELAQEVFGVNVKLYVPNQIGIRNPAFAHVISLSEYAGNLTDVDILAQAAVHGDQRLRQQPINLIDQHNLKHNRNLLFQHNR